MLRWRLIAPESCATISSPPRTGPVSWRVITAFYVSAVRSRSFQSMLAVWVPVCLLFSTFKLCGFGVADAPWRPGTLLFRVVPCTEGKSANFSKYGFPPEPKLD